MKQRIKRTVQVVIFATFFMATAQADDCIENAQDQAEMSACAQMDYLAAKATLTNHYEAMRQRVDGDDKTRGLLDESEKAWLAFRDAECTFATSKLADGSAYTMAKNICFTDLTKKRSDQLLDYLNCEDSGSNCPLPTTVK